MQTVGGVLFDIDGVLVTSWEPIEGAAETLKLLDQRSIARTFLTNTTSRTRTQIADALTDVGMPARPDEVLTAGALTAEYVRSRYPGARCFLLNSGDVTEDMPEIDFVDDDPEVIVLGGAGEEFTHLALSRIYEWMTQGVPVVAMHRSTTWSTNDGLRIDTGMYLSGMEEASGTTATAVGKPAPAGFRAAAERMGVDPEDVVMVGDDLHNDVLAAQVVGMTGVLVKTGKFREDVLERWARDEFAMQPDHVIDTIADLPGVLGI
ncbi:MAG TPA: HAD-IIA family hydrolase [Aldersonia sp.]